MGRPWAGGRRVALPSALTGRTPNGRAGVSDWLGPQPPTNRKFLHNNAGLLNHSLIRDKAKAKMTMILEGRLFASCIDVRSL